MTVDITFILLDKKRSEIPCISNAITESEMSNATRLMGVSDDNSFEAARALYFNLTQSKITRSSFVTAEISKLAENAFRDVNIATTALMSVSTLPVIG